MYGWWLVEDGRTQMVEALDHSCASEGPRDNPCGRQSAQILIRHAVGIGLELAEQMEASSYRLETRVSGRDQSVRGLLRVTSKKIADQVRSARETPMTIRSQLFSIASSTIASAGRIS